MDCIDCGGPTGSDELMRCEWCRLAALEAIAMITASLDESDVPMPPLPDDPADIARVTGRLAGWMAELLELSERNGGMAALQYLERMTAAYRSPPSL